MELDSYGRGKIFAVVYKIFEYLKTPKILIYIK